MRFRLTVFRCIGLLLMAIVGVVGCGGGGGGEEGGGGGETQAEGVPAAETTAKPSGGITGKAAAGQVIKTIEIEEVEYELRPAEVTLEKPGTYAFVAENTGGEVHALEIEGQGIEKKTKNIQPGQRTELKVNLKPGTYELYCPVANHKELGMDGSIKVAVKGGTDGNTGDSEGGSGGGY